MKRQKLFTKNEEKIEKPLTWILMYFHEVTGTHILTDRHKDRKSELFVETTKQAKPKKI